MKAKFTQPSESYVGKVDAVASSVALIKSANGVKMTVIRCVNAISALCTKRFDDLRGIVFSMSFIAGIVLIFRSLIGLLLKLLYYARCQ